MESPEGLSNRPAVQKHSQIDRGKVECFEVEDRRYP